VLDPADAAASYRRFRSTFLTRRFGVVGIREYPRGVVGGGDVDSGPLVAGLSVSATAVAIAAARANGDEAVAVSLTHEADVFGFPIRWFGTRRYLGGLLPIADAFLVWARTTPFVSPAHALANSPTAWWPAGLLGIPWLALTAAWIAVARRGWLRSTRRAKGAWENGPVEAREPAIRPAPGPAESEQAGSPVATNPSAGRDEAVSP
jgi:hypothetical protein